MKRSYLKLYLYISLIFLVVTLYLADFLVVPKIVSISSLIICCTLLFLGFIFDGISWAKILREYNFNTSYAVGIASSGRSIFGKYIPGKLWTILGRAGYVAQRYSYSVKELSFISLEAQFISIWVALVIGSVGLIVLDGFTIYGLVISLMFVGLTLAIFTNVFHGILTRLVSLVIKKDVEIPRLSFLKAVRIIPWFFLIWLFWSLSFYFLIKTISEEDVMLITGSGFALAGSIGIVAVIAPGGIGIREGVLTFFLTLAGFNVELAASISVVSRLWFLIGEAFIFLFSFIIQPRGK